MKLTFKRHRILDPLQENLSRKVHLLQILVGPRQVGKTTAIEQLLETWPHPTLYATADQLAPPDTGFISENWKQARGLKGEMPLLVIDEVQKIGHWSDAVKMLHDEDVRVKRNLRVVLLGSSALMLQRGMKESLAGRFQLIPCSHWFFPECQEAFGWSLNQFLFYGGYPGAVPFADDFIAWRDYVQNSLLETVVGRDIPAVQRVDNPALFRQTLHLACQHPAEIISLQKLVGQLQDRGSINTLANYLEFLSAAFLIRPVQKWSSRPLRVRASSPKLIVQNNALINALRNVAYPEALSDKVFYGRLVENTVGAALVNSGEEVYYWNDRDKEVDFVVHRGNKILAIEVKSGVSEAGVSGLKTFQARFPGAVAVTVGGEGADMSVEEFLEKPIIP